MIELFDETKDIISRVKSLSGKDVEMVEKQKLSTYATAKAARSSMDKNYIYYRETENLNYLIAYECAHMIRIFECDPDKRVIPAITGDGMKNAIQELKARHAFLNLPVEDDYYTRLINGFVQQLTSQPQDVWVEQYIYENYPGLRLEQKLNALHMWMDVVKLTPKEIQQFIAKFIWHGSYAMNIAFFAAFEKITGTVFAHPKWMESFNPTAKKLAAELNFSTSSLVDDIHMINAWADILDCHWANWIDFENIPEGYLEV